MIQYRLVWILSLCILTVLARNPGFKARITSKGLNYANDVAIQALAANVQKVKIPDQSGNSGDVEYQVSNIRVTQFTPPSSSISIDPGRGLTWKAANAGIAVKGDFRYKYKKGWVKVSDHGTFDAKASGVSFSLGMSIGEDIGGRPSIAASGCNSNIGDVDFHFHGGAAWIYNIFRNKVADTIKDLLNKQMCTLITKEINVDGQQKLAKLKVTTPLAKKFLLDYRLTQNPNFQTQYMETFHNGEIYWLSEPNVESPLVPPAMPDSTDTGSMLYLWISDYMFDTLGYQAQKHGFLVYNMTQKDLPADSRGVLNTTCDAGLCIGKLIPQIGQKYPNDVVELRMNSTTAPTMKITAAGVNLSFAGVIDLYANKPGKKTSPPVFLLSLDATMSTTVNVSVQNELLYAGIEDLKIKLKVGKSAVGVINPTFLDFLVNQALKAYLIPQLNDLGKKGFPLPLTGDINFQNTKISFDKDTLLISTDLKYAPSALHLEEELTGPLKFKSHIQLQ